MRTFTTLLDVAGLAAVISGVYVLLGGGAALVAAGVLALVVSFYLSGNASSGGEQ